jgi:DNA-binding transcriptional LysR family regulator
VDLFRRVGRRLELTDAGRMLVARADELLAHVEGIEAELAAFSGRLRGTVRVAAFQTAAHAVVLPAIDRLADDHPELRVELRELEAEESLPLVAGGALEVAVAEEYEHAPRPRLPRIHREYVAHDEMLLALPRGHEG